MSLGILGTRVRVWNRANPTGAAQPTVANGGFFVVYWPIFTTMQILRKGVFAVAIIDTVKKIGAEGQYKRYRGDDPSIDEIVRAARKARHEIRRYVEGLPSGDNGIIPLKYVITEVPPGHVQPFHQHSAVDEVNLIETGEVYFIESETLTEEDVEIIRERGTLLRAGDVVVSTSGTRHTLANLSNEYAHLIGTISAKSSSAEFKPDWIR